MAARLLASCYWQSFVGIGLAERPEGAFQLADHLIQAALPTSILGMIGFECDEPNQVVKIVLGTDQEQTASSAVGTPHHPFAVQIEHLQSPQFGMLVVRQFDAKQTWPSRRRGGRRSYGESSQLWIRPLSLQVEHSQFTYGGMSWRSMRIQPGHLRWPGRRRQGSADSSVYPVGIELAARMTPKMCSASFLAAGWTSGSAPSKSVRSS